jgi:glutamate racemase
LLAQFERLAPWPVAWIDPAPAIARQTAQVLRGHPGFEDAAQSRGPPGYAIFTGTAQPSREILDVLRLRGIAEAVTERMLRGEVRKAEPSHLRQ